MAVHGAEAVLGNITKFGGRFLATVGETMQVAADTLEHRVKLNSSLSDHTLKDLRELGHPYARKWGEQGAGLHEPYWQVHQQGGQLLESVYQQVDDAEALASGFVGGRSVSQVVVSCRVGFDESKAPHAVYVVWGTSRMIPRDPLMGSLGEVKGSIQDYIRTRLKGAVVSFRGIGGNDGGT